MANRVLIQTCLALVIAALPSLVGTADDFAAIFGRAVAYVAEFRSQFASVIWHEMYEQIDRLPFQFGSSGTQFTRATSRRLESEMLFISADANATWLTVRDVISVDGKPVPRHLPALLASKDVRIRDLRALSEENGKYNIGAIARNFNEPTLALLFLDPRYRSRFEFSDGGSELVDGQPARRIRFSETATPTVIQSQRRDVRASGALLVEPSTGRVLRTELILLQDQRNTRGIINVSYGMNARLGRLVPVEMREWYGYLKSTPDQGINCTATYTDFRRFETSGRVVPEQGVGGRE
jgi:hypothetical protein